MPSSINSLCRIGSIGLRSWTVKLTATSRHLVNELYVKHSWRRTPGLPGTVVTMTDSECRRYKSELHGCKLRRNANRVKTKSTRKSQTSPEAVDPSKVVEFCHLPQWWKSVKNSSIQIKRALRLNHRTQAVIPPRLWLKRTARRSSCTVYCLTNSVT